MVFSDPPELCCLFRRIRSQRVRAFCLKEDCRKRDRPKQCDRSGDDKIGSGVSWWFALLLGDKFLKAVEKYGQSAGLKSMSLTRSDVQELYTKRIERYASFIAAFQSPKAMRAFCKALSFCSISFVYWMQAVASVW
jgi:hypothetical protein